MFALRLAMKKLSDNDDGDVAEPVGNDWGNGREKQREEGEREKKATLSVSLRHKSNKKWVGSRVVG